MLPLFRPTPSEHGDGGSLTYLRPQRPLQNHASASASRHRHPVAMNLLRLIGQHTLNEPGSPVRHKAKRRRIKTVLQEILGKAARMISHAGGGAGPGAQRWGL